MDTITVTCPACGKRVTTDGIVCPRCGASIAAEVFAARAVALQALTARARRPAERGGSTVNGWGTMLLDYRPRGDGTWDALRWFSIAYFPLVPLRAIHLRPVELKGMISGRSYHYEVLDEARPPLARILRTYALVLAALLPALYAFTHMDVVNRLVGSGPGFFVTLATVAWGIFLSTRIINGDRAYKAATRATPGAG